ncbi:hypothetical protein NFX31_15240 [Microbacterium azadirachtae]|uniref:hypothetical protein n=1 Tax=Microbacterium azadirachtae TaxID=582680 RepID=UPI0021D48F82|nr:hypothetical protein [Microbacterium azadirachtae]UXW85540.1 hypothetical protein NFX31_15240 [Microbacterium azadirachtae]
MDDTQEQTGPTTHADWGAGHPRLLVSSRESRSVYDIPVDGATIGSAQECDLRLPGADPVHASIRHDSRDEYVLTMQGPGETSANLEKSQDEERRGDEILRTGARFTVGPWRLVFMRDEFADHGRPFGGREGGEFSDQQLQEPRPDYPDSSPAS